MWAHGRAGSREADGQVGGQKYMECRRANEIDSQADGRRASRQRGVGQEGMQTGRRRGWQAEDSQTDKQVSR